MKITAVVASYEGTKKWLPETLETLRNQTLPFDRITVDDSDRNTTHKWNDAIQNCESEYLALPHADDLYTPAFAKECVEYLDSHPECASVFTMDYIIDGSGRRIGHNVLPFPERDSYDFEFIFNAMVSYGHFLRCPSVVHRVSMVKEFKHDLSHGDTANDTALWFDILNKHKIGVINKQLYLYRQHDDSDTQKNVVGTASQYDHFLAMDYAAKLNPGAVPWLWPFMRAKKFKEREDKIEEIRLRGLAGSARSVKFIVAHEAPDNAGTGILCADRCRRNNAGVDGEVSIYVFPTADAYRIVERGELPIFKGVIALPVHPKRLGDAIAKYHPSTVEFHHLLRWEDDSYKYATHVHIHDSFLHCATWHQVNSENKPCPGPTEERCVKCVGKERYEETKARLETVKIHLPKRVYANSEWTAVQARRELGCEVKIHNWPVPPVEKRTFKKRVGYFGTFHQVKGTDVLLVAASKMPDVQFLLFCDPPEAFQWMIEGREVVGYPNILFMGSYHRSNIGSLCNLVDIVVVPSRCESWCITAREAKLAGKMVIATDTGGMADIGTVRPGDANDLIRAIREAM